MFYLQGYIFVDTQQPASKIQTFLQEHHCPSQCLYPNCLWIITTPISRWRSHFNSFAINRSCTPRSGVEQNWATPLQNQVYSGLDLIHMSLRRITEELSISNRISENPKSHHVIHVHSFFKFNSVKVNRVDKFLYLLDFPSFTYIGFWFRLWTIKSYIFATKLILNIILML